MTRRVLTDWAIVLIDGLLIGLGLVGASAAWVWWREGAVTLYAVETPLFVLSAILLVVGGSMSRPTLLSGRDAHLTGFETAKERVEDRRNRMAFGMHVIFGGVWGMLLVFLLDSLRR